MRTEAFFSAVAEAVFGYLLQEVTRPVPDLEERVRRAWELRWHMCRTGGEARR